MLEIWKNSRLTALSLQSFYKTLAMCKDKTNKKSLNPRKCNNRYLVISDSLDPALIINLRSFLYGSCKPLINFDFSISSGPFPQTHWVINYITFL
jgi:hypothetical protein